MALTLSNVLQGVYKALGELNMSKATGGSGVPRIREVVQGMRFSIPNERSPVAWAGSAARQRTAASLRHQMSASDVNPLTSCGSLQVAAMNNGRGSPVPDTPMSAGRLRRALHLK